MDTCHCVVANPVVPRATHRACRPNQEGWRHFAEDVALDEEHCFSSICWEREVAVGIATTLREPPAGITDSQDRGALASK